MLLGRNMRPGYSSTISEVWKAEMFPKIASSTGMQGSGVSYRISFLLSPLRTHTKTHTNTLPSFPEHPLVTSPVHPTNPLCLITERNLMTNSNYALMLPFMGFSIQMLSFFMPLWIQTTPDRMVNSKMRSIKRLRKWRAVKRRGICHGWTHCEQDCVQEQHVVYSPTCTKLAEKGKLVICSDLTVEVEGTTTKGVNYHTERPIKDLQLHSWCTKTLMEVVWVTGLIHYT